MTTATPHPLEARLAAELHAAADALSAAYTAAETATGRPMLRAADVVPMMLAGVRETARSLENLVTDPPANLRTRARLGEIMRDRAGVYLAMAINHAAACQTTAPPATVAAAADAISAEVARLEQAAAAFEGVTYDPGDEAGEAAAVLAAQARGEVIGARRALAALLGLADGENADAAAAAHVAAHRAAHTSDYYLGRES